MNVFAGPAGAGTVGLDIEELEEGLGRLAIVLRIRRTRCKE